MTWRLRVHVVTVAVATSYLTLGAANPDSAGEWWWAYALLTLILALVALVTEHD